MYFTDEITLIAYDEHQDEIGNWVKTPVETQTFCSISSTTEKEWNDAALHGLKPDCVATMRQCDYGGQAEAYLNGKRLHVYRTYADMKKSPDMIELHLEEIANA